MSGEIDRYLHELGRRLPSYARRMVEESAGHLHETRDRLVTEGVSPEEAERRAVEEYGTVEDVAAAVSENGGPTMSPHVRRVAALVALLLTLPNLVFIGANVIETLAGNSGGIGVFGTSLDNWENVLNVLITFGPVVGLLLVALTSVRFRISGERGAREATFQISLTRSMIVVGVLSGLAAAGVIGYLVTENIFCIPSSWDIC